MGSSNANGCKVKSYFDFEDEARFFLMHLGPEPVASRSRDFRQRLVAQLAWALHGRAYEGSCLAIVGRRVDI